MSNQMSEAARVVTVLQAALTVERRDAAHGLQKRCFSDVPERQQGFASN